MPSARGGSSSRRLRRPRELFFSRAEGEPKRLDRAIRGAVEVLTIHGVRVWTAPARVHGGDKWHDEIGKALERCDWYAVALTRHSVKRPWVQRELLYALRSNRYDGRIVPLLFEPCRLEKLSWTLPGFQIIDFTQDVDEAHRRLLAVWGIEPRLDRQAPRSARRPVKARVHRSR